MITDQHGQHVDYTTAMRRLVAALDRRFPDHNTPGDRLGRLLEEVGELAEEVLAVQQPVTSAPGRNWIPTTTKELQDVLRAAAGIAHHYDLLIDLADLANEQTRPSYQGDPYLLLGQLVQSAGMLAKSVHHAGGMGIKREKYGPVNMASLAESVNDVLARTVRIADYYELRQHLRSGIEDHYRRYQRDGFLTEEVLDETARPDA